MVSGNNKECMQGKLLSARKIEDGTGESQSEEVILSLNEWGITEKVACMCFDTTSSNTGWIKGACIKIEQKLGKPLLWLACRHHIHELFIKAAFHSIYGEDNSPEALSIILLVTSDITEEVSDKAVISGDADSNVVCPVGKMASSVEILPGNFQ